MTRLLTCSFLLISALVAAISVSAQQDNQQKTPDQLQISNSSLSTQPLPTIDKNSVEIFSDAAIKNGMQSLKVPGVSLAIVYQGQPLLLKGYGSADLENDIPVSAESSEFAVASISKTFTFTALLELIDQGKLSWNDKVEDVLGQDLFDDDSSPILIKHLFTHSAGFEDSYLGQSAAIDEETNISLMEYITQFAPSKLSDTDQYIVYSNYSASLAGAVIEKVSAQPFSNYMQNYLLKPLGMNHSSFYDTPTPNDGSPIRAVGYHKTGYGLIEQRKHFHHFGLLPTAGLKTTASDMAKYMQFHLDRNQPLAAVNTIGTNVFHKNVSSNSLPIKSNHPAIGGSAFGFWVNDFYGLTSIGHSGNTKGFKSELIMFPELSLGVFISANANHGHRLTTPFTRNFVKQFFREYLVSPKTISISTEELNQYRGLYLSKRRNESSIERMAAPSYFVGAADDRLKVYVGNNIIDLLPIGNGVFLDKDTGKKVAFTRDKNGNAVILREHDVSEKIKGWQDTGNLLKVLNLIAVLSAIILGLRSMRWYFKVAQKRIHISLGRIMSAIAVSWLTFYFCLYQTMASFGVSLYPAVFFSFPDTWTIIGQFALVLVSLFSLIGFCLIPKLALNKEVPLRVKLGYPGFLILVTLVLVWSTYFNMLFFKF